MNKNFNKLFILLIIFVGVLFFNVDGVKADDICSCYYSYGLSSTVGENSSETTETLQFYQIDYSASGATVKRACGHNVINNNLSGTNLITAIKDKCSAPSIDPIDHNNFNVNYSSIAKNCTVENCGSTKIYFDEKAKNGKVLSTVKTSTSISLEAREKENWEEAVQNAQEREKDANNYDSFNDISVDDIEANEEGITKAKKGSNNCDLIPESIISFLNSLFLIIQVIGIILLVVMSMIEFIKAITASSEDGLKGAIKNTYRRIIIAIILLILPMFIIWILNITNANAYKTDENGKRIIGENGNPLCK